MRLQTLSERLSPLDQSLGMSVGHFLDHIDYYSKTHSKCGHPLLVSVQINGYTSFCISKLAYILYMQASVFCLVCVHSCWQGHKLRYCHSDSLTDIRATSSRLQIRSKDQKLALQESSSPLAPYLDGLGMECHRLNNCWVLSFLAMRQPLLDYSDNMMI